MTRFDTMSARPSAAVTLQPSAEKFKMACCLETVPSFNTMSLVGSLPILVASPSCSFLSEKQSESLAFALAGAEPGVCGSVACAPKMVVITPRVVGACQLPGSHTNHDPGNFDGNSPANRADCKDKNESMYEGIAKPLNHSISNDLYAPNENVAVRLQQRSCYAFLKPHSFKGI
jgi:hypothetical protein